MAQKLELSDATESESKQSLQKSNQVSEIEVQQPKSLQQQQKPIERN